MNGTAGFIGGKNAFGVEDEISGDEFEVILCCGIVSDFLEFSEIESGIQTGVFDVDASHFEAFFNRVAQNEAAENGSGSNGIG